MSAAAQMLSGGLVMTALSSAMGEQVPAELPAKAVAAWVYLGIFGSIIGFTAYTYLLRVSRPAVATSYAYVNPALAVVAGATLGGERLGPEMVVALLVIVAATVLVIAPKAFKAKNAS